MADGGRPILVTGSIRSGTTWVGRMLGTAPGVAVVHEPFNRDHPVGVFAHHWSHQYAFLTKGGFDSEEVAAAMTDTLSFRYRAIQHLRHHENMRRTLGVLREAPRLWYRHMISRPRPVLKDPIAFFSAEWLAETFDMDVLVLVRHPGAFVWSYQRIGEPNRFGDLLDQEALIDGPLAPFRHDVERAARDDDPILQAATLWRVVYSLADIYQARHPEWITRRHEDLSHDPVGGFGELFQRLGLDFTSKARRLVEKTTSSDNPTEAPSGALHHLHRNSRANTRLWQHRLSSEDVRRIRDRTGEVADLYYGPSSWP